MHWIAHGTTRYDPYGGAGGAEEEEFAIDLSF